MQLLNSCSSSSSTSHLGPRTEPQRHGLHDPTMRGKVNSPMRQTFRLPSNRMLLCLNSLVPKASSSFRKRREPRLMQQLSLPLEVCLAEEADATAEAIRPSIHSLPDFFSSFSFVQSSSSHEAVSSFPSSFVYGPRSSLLDSLGAEAFWLR